MAYPQHLLTDDESVLREFHPHWRTLAGAASVVVIAVIVAWVTWLLPPDRLAVDRIVTGIAGAVAVGYGGWRLLRWRTTQYVLTTERLIHRAGIVSRSGLEIPLEQINTVSFSQRPVERLLRYGDLLIESAGATGQSRLTDVPDPERFQSEVYAARDRRTGAGHATGDVVDRLERLEALRDRGTITAQEFEAQKRRVLDDG